MGKINHKMEIISKWKLVRDHSVSMLFSIKVDGNRISVMEKHLKGSLLWVIDMTQIIAVKQPLRYHDPQCLINNSGRVERVGFRARVKKGFNFWVCH